VLCCQKYTPTDCF